MSASAATSRSISACSRGRRHARACQGWGIGSGGAVGEWGGDAGMTTLQAIVIAILQGATELFPVSSLGHAVILPALLRWNLDQSASSFLPFLVMLHVGTA